MQTYQSLPAVKGPECYYLLSLFLRTLGNQSEFAQGSILQEAEDFCFVAILHHFVAAAVVLIQGASAIFGSGLILHVFCFSFNAPNAPFAFVLFLKAILLFLRRFLLCLLFTLITLALSGGFSPVSSFPFGRKFHAYARNIEGNKLMHIG